MVNSMDTPGGNASFKFLSYQLYGRIGAYCETLCSNEAEQLQQ